MAKIIQVPYRSDIVIPVETAQSVQANRETTISLEALGLLVNILSYPPTWELHKTELYKRFAHNKEASVRNAWNKLIAANYIIEFKYRVGKKWEYVYYVRKVPFNDDEKAQILDTAVKEYGGIWRLDFQDLKMKSSKSRGNQDLKYKQNPKENNNIKNINIDIDDDKRTSSQPHNEEIINQLISHFREVTKDELSERSFKAVVRKVVDKYNQGKVSSFRDYFVTALSNKIIELELRKAKGEAKERLKNNKEKHLHAKKNELEKQTVSKNIPLYNWLEE